MLSVLCANPAHAQEAVERPFPVVDEGPDNADFLAFRTRLLDIVERRDLSSLLAVISPNIMFSFAGAPGVEGFRKHWQLDEGATELWSALAVVLRLGGSFQGPEIFVAPYVHSKWPADLSGDVDLVATVRDHVPVYEAAEASARVVRRLPPVIVAAEHDGNVAGRWHKVQLKDGQNGYVQAGDARRPTDLRAFFARSPTGWLMVICIDGD